MTLKQFFTVFDGRINRQTWWIGFAMFFGVAFFAYVIAIAINVMPIFWLVALALIYPQVAVGCKRFHDMGKSGWYQLIGLIPFVGGLILIVWLGVVEGDAGDNAFGSPQSAKLEFKWE